MTLHTLSIITSLSLCVSYIAGIKYIPLRTPGGELIPESGLFLRIKKEEEEGSQGAGQRGGVRRGVAQQRRKRMTHQEEISGEEPVKQTVCVKFPTF